MSREEEEGSRVSIKAEPDADHLTDHSYDFKPITNESNGSHVVIKIEPAETDDNTDHSQGGQPVVDLHQLLMSSYVDNGGSCLEAVPRVSFEAESGTDIESNDVGDTSLDVKPVRGGSLIGIELAADNNGFSDDGFETLLDVKQATDGSCDDDDPTRPYLCMVCSKRFKQQSDLKRHIQIHVGGKCYVCDVCEKRFTQKGYLHRHLLVHTGTTRSSPFSCDLCNQRFTQKSSLKVHQRIHSGEKPYLCTVCQKGFAKKSDLTAHDSKHTGLGLYVCSVCSKWFTRKSDLNRHEKVHMVERPVFQCTVCLKTFTEKGSLDKHYRLHMGVRPYLCTVCDRHFARKAHLDSHERTHASERQTPYLCTFCGKQFAEKGYLSIHVRIHTGERPYPCSQCEKSFTKKGDVDRHMRRMHATKKQHFVERVHATTESAIVDS